MHDQLLRRFYTAHGYQTVWDTHPAEASHLWNAVLLAGKQGLDPSLFHSSVITERGRALSPIERDLLLSDAFLSYADALSRGAMPIEDRLDDEDLTPEPVDVVAVLDAALASPESGAADRSARPVFAGIRGDAPSLCGKPCRLPRAVSRCGARTPERNLSARGPKAAQPRKGGCVSWRLIWSGCAGCLGACLRTG